MISMIRALVSRAALVVFTAVFMPLSASAVYVGISAQLVQQDFALPTAGGSWDVWQIYADFDDTSDELTLAYGDATDPLTISTSPGNFFQYTSFPSDLEQQSAIWVAFPDLQYDTWVGIGFLINPAGTPTSLSPGWPGFLSAELYLDNGTWYRTPADPETVAGPSGRVLMGQFTVPHDDCITGTVNLQGSENGFGSFNFKGISFAFNCVSLVITNPSAASVTVTESIITLGGTGDELTGNLTWSNQTTGAFGTAPVSSPFSTDVPLQEGANSILITGTNIYGKGASDGITVTYDPPDAPLYSQKITFCGYDGDEPLTNFPVLIKFSEGVNGLSFGSFSSPSDGADLRFCDQSQTNELNYEINSWDTNGTACVWVQVDVLTSNSCIYAKWGSDDLTNAPSYRTDGSTWSQDYIGVWHLDSTNANDSSGNGFDGSSFGVSDAPGIVGTAQEFETVNSEGISLGDLNASDNGIYTHSIWLSATSLINNLYIIGEGNSGDGYPITGMALGGGGNVSGIYRGTSPASVTGTDIVQDGEWHQAVMTGDGNAIRLYIDGREVSTNTIVAGASLNVGSIGYLNRLAPCCYMDGLLDEARMSSVPRSSNWIYAAWLTMASNDSFSCYGPVIGPEMVLTWEGDISDKWTVAENWDLNFIPRATDDIDFTASASTFGVDLEGGQRQVNGVDFMGATPYAISNGTLIADSGIDVAAASVTHILDCGMTRTDLADAEFSVGNGATLIVQGPITGEFPVVKSGSGTLVLNGINTYTGQTTLAGGYLEIGADHNLGPGPLEFQSGGFGLIVTSSLAMTRPIILTSAYRDFRMENSSTCTLNGVVSGSGSFIVHEGTLRPTATNTFSSSPQVSGGTISIREDANLGAGSTLYMTGGGLRVEQTTSSSRDFSLGGGGEFDVLPGQTFTMDQGFSGSGIIGKYGGGILEITQASGVDPANTDLFIHDGLVLANNASGSLLNGSDVEVRSGGTLGGTGILAGLTQVQDGGTISPGVSPGILTVGSVIFSNGSTFDVELGGLTPGSGHDQLIVSSSAVLAGTLTLSYTNGFSATRGDSFDVLVGNSITGTFDSVVPPATGELWTVRYLSGIVRATFAGFSVTNSTPAHTELDLLPNANITVEFSESISNETVNSASFKVWGKQTGFMTGDFSFGSATLNPDGKFKPGEDVVVMLNTGVLSTAGDMLLPHQFEFVAAAEGCDAFSLNTNQTISPNNSYRVALGDLNGDGYLDAVVAAQLNILILLNDGVGTYNTSPDPGSTGSSGVSLGDLNEDGHLDAFVTSFQNNRVYFNQGDGTFITNQVFPAGSGDNNVDLGDLDGDGDLDALVCSEGGPNTVLKNDGTGMLSTSTTFGASDQAQDVELGDLDGDGDLDAFFTESDTTDKVYRNDGTGVFTLHQQLGDGSATSSSVSLGDLDGDGDLDAVLAYGGVAGDRVYLNDGTGIFSTKQLLGANASTGVELGDLDGDGDLDACIVGGGFVSVYANDGTGTFSTNSNLSQAGGQRDVALGDIDGDGDLDAFVAVSSGADRTYLNTGCEPRLHWQLEEGTGTNTKERISGEANVAALIGPVAWTNGIAPGSDRAVKLSNEGAINYIDAGTLLTDGTYTVSTGTPFEVLNNNWTVTAWIKIDDPRGPTQPLNIISSDWLSPGNWTFRFQHFGPVNNNLIFDFGSTPEASSIELPLGTTLFIAMVFDSSGLGGGTSRHRFGVWDGASWSFKEGTTANSLRLQGLEIGSFATGLNRMDGIIDDVCIFGRTLTQFELDRMTRADTDGDGILDYRDPDDDNDGLTDSEEQPGGTNTKDPNTDDDPQSDYEEYIADTDGTDSNLFFHLTSISNVNSKTVYFDSSSNRIYTMEFTTNLLDSGSWSDLSPTTTEVPGAGGPDSLTDTNDVEVNKNYRIQVELP